MEPYSLIIIILAVLHYDIDPGAVSLKVSVEGTERVMRFDNLENCQKIRGQITDNDAYCVEIGHKDSGRQREY